MDKIVAKIKTLCGEKGISIKFLLKRANLSSQIIDDWENKVSSPSIPALVQICKVLEIPLQELFRSEQISLTAGQTEFLSKWNSLSEKEKSALKFYIEAMRAIDCEKAKE